MSDTPVLGIDLGTTNSSVAITEDADTRLLDNANGESLTPSAVQYPVTDQEQAQPFVGTPAVQQQQLYPDRTFTSIKREMADDIEYTVDDRRLTPANISSDILRSLKEDAATRLGFEPARLTECVIAVPAYWEGDARSATRAAARMAEFDEITLITEPTAAALAYGYRKQGDTETVLVWDLGGGTFDCSIVEIGDGRFTVLSTNGDRYLGGDDWDDVVVDWVRSEFESEFGVDPLASQPWDTPGELAHRRAQVREAVVDCKEQLCSQGHGNSTILLAHLMPVEEGGSAVTFQRTLDMQTFEDLTKDLLNETREPTRQTLSEAGLTPADLDEVLLVGGATRMPQVDDLISEELSKIPNRTINPDEAVARGAAIKGGGEGILLQEALPLSLGIEVSGGKFRPIIDRGATLPTKSSQKFTTSKDNQTNVQIDVYQGERPIATDNRHMKRFYLTGIPRAPRGAAVVDVTFDVTSEGIVRASAHLEGGPEHAEKQVQIEGITDYTDAEIQEHIETARANRQRDMEREKRVDVLSRAREVRDHAERYLEDHRDVFTAGEINTLQNLLDDLQKALDSEASTNSIAESSERLEDELISVSSKLINQRNSSSGSQTNHLAESPGQTESPSIHEPNSGEGVAKSVSTGEESGGDSDRESSTSSTESHGPLWSGSRNSDATEPTDSQNNADPETTNHEQTADTADDLKTETGAEDSTSGDPDETERDEREEAQIPSQTQQNNSDSETSQHVDAAEFNANDQGERAVYADTNTVEDGFDESVNEDPLGSMPESDEGDDETPPESESTSEPNSEPGSDGAVAPQTPSEESDSTEPSEDVSQEDLEETDEPTAIPTMEKMTPEESSGESSAVPGEDMQSALENVYCEGDSSDDNSQLNADNLTESDSVGDSDDQDKASDENHSGDEPQSDSLDLDQADVERDSPKDSTDTTTAQASSSDQGSDNSPISGSDSDNLKDDKQGEDEGEEDSTTESGPLTHTEEDDTDSDLSETTQMSFSFGN